MADNRRGGLYPPPFITGEEELPASNSQGWGVDAPALPFALIQRSVWKEYSANFALPAFSEVQVQGVRGFLAPAADRFARRPPPQRWQRWSLARRAFRTTGMCASPPSRHGGCCRTRGWPVCPDA